MQFNISELNQAFGRSNPNRNQNGKNNNKKKNRNKNHREDNKNNSSAILNSGMDEDEFERGSGGRFFDNSDAEDGDEKVSEEVGLAETTMDAFLEEYKDMCKERGNQVTGVIREFFWEISKIMTHYYEPKYEPVSGQMNKVLDVIASQRFANALTNILSNEDIDGWNDGVHDIWKDVMFVISTTLVTCHKSMKDDTIEAYIDLLTSSGLAGKDIERLAKELGITKDLAVDLVAAIPVIPGDMTDITLKQFYNSFVLKLMEHAEENIDVLDRGTQGKLFTFFFGKDRIALKAIGRMLAESKIAKFSNEAQKLVYAEYLCMLSDRLDAYDIKDIKYVLKFIASEKKRRGKDVPMLFGSVAIVEYNSIRKAEFELIASDAEAKEYLITT